MKPINGNDNNVEIFGLLKINLIFHHINKKLEAKFGLSLVQWALLKTVLEMPAISHLQLSQELGVTPGTLSQTLNRLVKKSLLFICEDPKDARKKMISITRSGKNILDTINQHYDQIFTNIQGIGKELKLTEDFLTFTRSRLAELPSKSLL